MRFLGGLVGAIVLATTTQAGDMPNTNLVCIGTRTVTEPAVAKKVEKFREVYRIDYESNRWCYGACKDISPIVSVTNERITLSLTSGSLLTSTIAMDRIAGTLESHASFTSPLDKRTRMYDIVAPCMPQPFTGLTPDPEKEAPKPKF